MRRSHKTWSAQGKDEVDNVQRRPCYTTNKNERTNLGRGGGGGEEEEELCDLKIGGEVM